MAERGDVLIRNIGGSGRALVEVVERTRGVVRVPFARVIAA
jgi:hypothetical protein